MNVFEGKTIYPGTAIGRASISSFVRCNQTAGTQDAYTQKERYFKAKENVKNDLVSLCATDFDSDVYDIIKSYILILEDEEYDSLVLNIINVEKTSAECAVKKASEHFASMLKKSGDAYIKGRVSDVYDLSDRIRETLKEISSANNSPAEKTDTKEEVILVSEYMSVTEIIKRGKENIAGLISTKNTLHSHASIVARSLGIPAIIVSDLKDISSLAGKKILIDGFEGKIYIEPSEEIVQEKKNQKEVYAHSADGITVYANVTSAKDVDDAVKFGADGIGLFRTEMFFLGNDYFPTEEEQFEIYKQAAINAAGKDIVLRTVDLGDDKTPAYLNLKDKELRGIKLCLSMTEIFKTQLKALLRASAFGNISIMFPMISSMDEVIATKQIIDEVKTELRSKNIAFNESIKIGAMIETPEAVEIADSLAKEFDFFSVGSNDLTQYALNIDRLNSAEEKNYNQKDPKVLALIEKTVEAAHNAGITVGICGELASDISFMSNLKAIGFDYISVSIPVLEKIKCK
ncbi:MAG: phosphoenolpyruvate--protein phosphotransferase [Lachnospiraceae bacterium]|nr:phosphoenolpyruvate--protein phosphotransferase [Lachnospiraceae bacterium]